MDCIHNYIILNNILLIVIGSIIRSHLLKYLENEGTVVPNARRHMAGNFLRQTNFHDQP